MGDYLDRQSGWQLARNGKLLGSVSDKKLRALAEKGNIQPSDLIWKPGFDGWREARSIPGLLTPPTLEAAAHLSSSPLRHFLRAAIVILGVFGSLALLAAVLKEGNTGPQLTASEMGWRKIAGKSQGTVAGGTVIVTADKATDASVYQSAIHGICAGKSHCYLLFWTDDHPAPMPGPLTDTEADRMMASYTYNATTGYREFLWDCRRVSGKSDSECLWKPD